MRIELTTSEKNGLLREVLTGTIETDHFKRLFQFAPMNVIYIKEDEYNEGDYPEPAVVFGGCGKPKERISHLPKSAIILHEDIPKCTK